MNAYINICVHACIHTYMLDPNRTSTLLDLNSLKYTYIHTHIHINSPLHRYILTYTYTNTHIYIHTHTYIHTVHTYMYSCIHSNIETYST